MRLESSRNALPCIGTTRVEPHSGSAPGRLALNAGLTLIAIALAGCATRPQTVVPSEGHLSKERVTTPGGSDLPPPVRSSAFVVPPPKPAPKPATYSVVVQDVPVRELLQALARDSRQNIDIHPGLTGLVSINAINETLPAILERISRQVNLRFQQEGNTIQVTPDTPFLKTYRVNYVNMTRETESRIGVSGEISGSNIGGSSGGGSGGSGGGSGGSSGTGTSSTTVRTTVRNDFWASLQDNIRSILASSRAQSLSAQERSNRAEAVKAARDERLAQAEAVARAGAGATALFKEAFSNTPNTPGDVKDDIVVNPVSGTISVLATERQHLLIQQHIDSVTASVQRQVLIEATIVEVTLSDSYQAGIDWSRLAVSGGITFTQKLLGGFGTNLNQAGNNSFQVGYSNPNSRVGNITGTVKLLEEFGNTRVLSSPKLMALNNQTALLKVVDNIVYFEVQAQTNTTQGVSVTTVNTTPKAVSVGVVMGVTPQVNEDGRVTLSVRPTISRILRFKNDPNPNIPIPNPVPEIQVREMESVLQVGSGQTVVLGGLMQDDTRRNREQIPGADTLGSLGDLFRFRDERTSKSELVIFLRPTVVTSPSVESDELRFFQRFLPQQGEEGTQPRDRTSAAR